MMVVTLPSVDHVKFVSQLIGCYRADRPGQDGCTLRLDAGMTEILAGLPEDNDGHYDGSHLWMEGSEYPMRETETF